MKSLPVINLHSEYVPMRDGIRLAISSWSTADDMTHDKSYPVVLVTTRYWRAMALSPDNIDDQAYTGWAKVLIDNGYRLVVADARGTGASFGTRDAEVDSNEVSDIAELIGWVAHQPWCDGRVATHGTSYSGITTLYSLATAPSPLKLGICRAPDFDMYRHLIAPGGIVNEWFVSHWGAYTAAQDSNSVKAMFACGYVEPPEQTELDNMLGVLPVDEDKDGVLLAAAVREHKNNFKLADTIGRLDCIDGFLSEKNPGIYDPVYREIVDKSNIALVIRCGWHDAATALGALSLFTTFKQLPVQVILGPFNHEGTYIVDPFQSGDDTQAEPTPLDEGRAWRIDYLNKIFNQPAVDKDTQPCNTLERYVHYYTLGENRWKKTRQWPLRQTSKKHLYFNQANALTLDKPATDMGSDDYVIDNSTSTGRFNRWHAQAADQPVYFPDRTNEDSKLLVYDSAPLTETIEITGHPVVSLYLRSSAADGQFFVYLEVIDSDGRVRLLTEGQMRGIHRQVSDEQPPYTMFGPYHSLQAKDAKPLAAGEITQLKFDLLPISVQLKKGQQLRLAIAGADSETFAPLAQTNNTKIQIERNAVYPSSIELPIVSGSVKQ